MDDVDGRIQWNDFKMYPDRWVLQQTEEVLEAFVRRFMPEFAIQPSDNRKKKLTKAAMVLLRTNKAARSWVK
jgi:hypothetical protein